MHGVTFIKGYKKAHLSLNFDYVFYFEKIGRLFYEKITAVDIM